MKILFPILSLLFATTPANALSLPLEGYFHPGRAMPVKWDVGDSGSDINLIAPHAITSRVHPSGNPWGVFPWIVIGPNLGLPSPQNLGPLQPLEQSDLLVIDTIGQDTDTSSLFPHRRVITLHVDPDDLTGPAMAWESADAILLTPTSFAKIPQEMRNALFAEGIELAVFAQGRPDAQLPWVQSSPWWTASSNLSLPPAICPDAYAPTFGWTAGRSPAFRRQIVLLGVAYCLIVLGLSLFRLRWTPAAIVVCSIAAAGIFGFMNKRQSPIFTQAGAVRLNAAAPIEDDWLYQVSHRQTPFILPLGGSVHPIFSDDSQPQSLQLVLDCDQTGEPTSISGTLAPDEPLALMRRRLAPAAESSPLISPATSPLRLLATESIYPGFAVSGQMNTPPAADSWPTIVLSPE